MEIDQGTEYLAVPADFHGPLELLLQGDPEIVLDYLEEANLQQQKQAGRGKGAPRWYAIVGGDLQLHPPADQDYAGELTYVARMPSLSAANSGNWILTDYPDAYLYGALTQSAPYLKDDARITTWGTLFSSALDDICNADPLPGEQSRLRSELSRLTGGGMRAGYDISTDA
jgi:hypothetical protein